MDIKLPGEDVLSLVPKLLTKVRTWWLKGTYPFAAFGRGVSIHYSCDIRRSSSFRIHISDDVYIASDAWLNVPEPTRGKAPTILLGNGCKIGRRCMITAKNEVRLKDNVMLGPSVVIADHSHEFSDLTIPIHAQGLTEGGRIYIEENCWVGFGAAIICTSGTLVIGRNSVIGANSVVTRSIPPATVVAGNPSKIIRRYCPQSRMWVEEVAPSQTAG